MSLGGVSRGLLLLLAAAALAFGVAGGLARLGVPIELRTPAAYHAALMICGFLGTVIALERAVALGGGIALAAPAAAAAGTVLTLLGFTAAGATAWLAASLCLFAATLFIARRQPRLHVALLAVGAAAWSAGNVLNMAGMGRQAVAWWLAFLVVTIVAERLELTRLLPRRRAAGPTLAAALACLLGGALAGVYDPGWGAIAFGASLVALAAWLATFDLARRTVRFTGLARFAAVALLGGYFWLAIAGLAWIAAALPGGAPLRDAALHALGLGFIVSMIIAHAPIVLPAVTGIRLRYSPIFYAPLALLHASLALRLLAGFRDPGWRMAGGVLNAGVFVLLVVTLVVAARQAAAPRTSLHARPTPPSRPARGTILRTNCAPPPRDRRA